MTFRVLRKDAGIAWRQWRLALDLGIGFAAVAAAALTAVPAAEATPATAAAGPAVIQLAEAPPILAVPRDGRLDGYGFAGNVLGVATADKVDGQSAGAGRQWWIVGVRWQVTPVSPPAAVALSVVAEGQATVLPLPADAATSPDTGPLYWAVAEPTVAPEVTLHATSQDLTQAFSLTHLRRTGPAPAVLYRTPGQWRIVEPVDQTVTRDIPDFSGGPSGGLGIELHAVTVTDFGPAGPNDTPPAGAGAWLTVALSSTNNPDDYTRFYNDLPASEITLAVAGHAPIDATITPGGGLDAGSNGVFGDRYGFPVPAGITGATLTITPAHLSVGNLVYPIATFTLAPATFTVALPAPASPAIPAVYAVEPRHYKTLGSSPARPAPTASSAAARTRTPGSDTDLVAVLGAIAVLAAVAVMVVRSRRSREKAPIVQWATAPPGTGPPPPAGSGNGWPPSQPRPVPPPGSPPPPQRRATGDRDTATTRTTRDGDDSGSAERIASVSRRVGARATPRLARPAVSVMGPTTVEGWVGERPRRTAVVDLVVYLACHPERPVTGDVLRAALSGPETDLGEDTLRTYASHARRALGPDHLPPAGERGYQLVDVDLDWTTFQILVADAATQPDDQARNLLNQALRLVRGRALPDTGRWADLENLPAVIDLAVTTTAARLAKLHLDAGDPAAAFAAAEVGLDITPTDQACAVAALTAGALTGRLAPTWQRITRAWASHDIEIPPELAALRQRLALPA